MKNLIAITFILITNIALSGEGSINGGPSSKVIEIISYEGKPNFQIEIPTIQSGAFSAQVIELCKDGNEFRNVRYDDKAYLYKRSTAQKDLKFANLGFKETCLREEEKGKDGEQLICVEKAKLPITKSQKYKLKVYEKKRLFGIFKRTVEKTKFIIPNCN